ncbi:helix-turn-helix transcriptional regulator [Ramlibacter tataouinensis]|uniref:helix-turn-helix domain-containing protein n=1 Tax=Ramlibacter tataouinensis TaxID=94132 RepID=UPI0022F3D354|nr:helix-turn-helix transcriptional regulator [Ramlibacter tataouinensis]WBY00523.1 helix-turn-helix transcriptional regulator [Ramlibacter tataouinensis]
MSGEPDRREEIARRLREAREYLGLSQDQVARALNLSRPAITNLENGSREVKALELDALSRIYGKSVTYFLEGESADFVREQLDFVARRLKGLSEQDLRQVARFADFLRASPKSSKKR